MNKKEFLNLGIKLCNELVKRIPIESYTKHYEGRKNAEKIEKNWIARFPKSFKFNGKDVKIIIPEKDDRSWIDFILIYGNLFFPINFKAGVGKTEDNISGLKYLGFLLFNGINKDFEVKRIDSHRKLAENIIALKKKEIKIDLTNRDYFCIAYNLENENIKIIPVSCIVEEDLKVNPSNVFQTNFHNVKYDIERTQEESINFIIKKYIEYSKKKANAYILFKKYGLIQDGK